MKKSIFLLLALMAAAISCDKIETDNENVKDAVQKNDSINQNDSVLVIDSLFFSGTLTADASSGKCTTPDTKISVNYTDKSDSVSITIFKAKLAERMPAMDIIIPGITIMSDSGVSMITTDESIPLAMGNQPFPNYTVTEFTGSVTSDSISFSLKFGKTPTSYQGHIQMQ